MAPMFVLITGCSAGGIGSALAVAFQKRGLSVFATGRDLSKLSHLEELLKIIVLPLDPTSAGSVETAVEKVKALTGGKLDYLVDNAGQTIIMPTLDFDIDTAKSMYDINVWGTVRVTQAFADLVIAAKGTVVNICSISTSVNTSWMGESLHACSESFTRGRDRQQFAGWGFRAQVFTQAQRQRWRPSPMPFGWKWRPLASRS